jgi:cytochrome c553
MCLVLVWLCYGGKTGEIMKSFIAAALLAVSFSVGATDLGQIKYTTMCSGCHGATAQGIVGPRLTGQTAEELTAKLNTYRNRGNVGPRSAMMWGVASQLGNGDVEVLVKHITNLKEK